ncbi:carboxypeptidase-like regulatory domain-containing protein [Pedobacter sp. NJ-S-72]
MRKIYLKYLSVFLLTLLTVNAFAQKTLTGTVRDASGPVPGVSVSLKGSYKVTQTDGAGKFSIAVGTNDILSFSAVGYAKQEISVGNQTLLNVTMKESENSLNEVVVTTALGIKRQEKSLGYAVSTVSAKQLTEAGNTNFASALYGKAAGVKITTAPGGPSSVCKRTNPRNQFNQLQSAAFICCGWCDD